MKIEFSKEHCLNISKSRQERLKRLGYLNSPETRLKMSNIKKGKKLSEEHKEKIGKAHKGMKRSKETCLNIGNGVRGKKRTKQQRLNISIATSKRSIQNKLDHNWSFGYCGHFYSKKNKKDIYYQSSIEYAFYIGLEFCNDVEKYEVGPSYIQYEYKNENYNYIPDVLIYYKDGTKQLVEIKPLGRVKDKVNQAKFKAAKKYSKEKNIEFKVWTESGFVN